MSDPWVRPVDKIADVNEETVTVEVGVDYDAVYLKAAGRVCLDDDGLEALVRALLEASREAGYHSALMAQDAEIRAVRGGQTMSEPENAAPEEEAQDAAEPEGDDDADDKDE